MTTTAVDREPGGLSNLWSLGILQLLLRFVIGGTFVYLGTLKIMDEPQSFLKSVKEYNLLPTDPPWINLTTVIVPWIEVVAGSAFIIGFFRRGAAALLGGMLLAFTGAIMLRAFGVQAAEGVALCSIQFDCGCGQGEVLVCKKFLSNSLLFVGCLPILFSRNVGWCLDQAVSEKLRGGASRT